MPLLTAGTGLLHFFRPEPRDLVRPEPAVRAPYESDVASQIITWQHTSNMTISFEPDIAALTLSDVEKNGLQVFRNFSKVFDTHRAKVFTESALTDETRVQKLIEVLVLVACEEQRTLPVIACAFADDQLKEMFHREISDGVPGGRGELLSGFGPLSRLSQRLQMAHAFD